MLFRLPVCTIFPAIAWACLSILSDRAVKPRHLGRGYKALLFFFNLLQSKYCNTFSKHVQMYQVLRLRIYRKHYAKLNKLASAVNFVWNYVNDLCLQMWRRKRVFPSAYDIAEYTKGAGEELGLHSQTIQFIREKHYQARKQHKKVKLAWRTNRPDAKRKALGWIPFKASAISHVKTYNTGKKALKSQVQLSCGKEKLILTVYDQYDLRRYSGFRTAEIVQDSCGDWYLCLVVKVEAKTCTATGEIGIDLGCKTAATCSNGDKLETKFTQQYAEKLASAQRAHKKKQTKRIHRKIKNSRADVTHKFTSKLVRENRLIVAGNVKSSSFTSGKLAKSVYDANWFAINRQLEYKSRRAGCQFIVVDEKFSTQTCANCLQITNISPKGVAGLGIREWICDCCGQLNDRDVNAAKNILRFGRETLAGGNPVL